MKPIAAILLVSLLSVSAFAANPATKPADTVVVENAASGFAFSVPKAWKAREKTPRVQVFELPGDAGSTRGGIFLIQVGRPIDKDAALTDIVNAKKKQLTDKSDKVKFLADKEEKLDGETAWRLEYLFPVAAKETTTVNGKAGEAKEVTLMNHSVEIMCMKDHQVFDVIYVGMDANSAARIKRVEAAVASFHWTTAAKSAPPDKK